jgi:tRNA-(ms[2]io[6]A)-hydroxylase
VNSSGLPLLLETPRSWAELAASQLPVFLADHAICEQQAALFGLNLVAHYPRDGELVRRMTGLAAEEITHLRRVVRILHDRGLGLSPRRANPYVRELHRRIRRECEQELKLDRLLVGALIEARSCERFTRLLEVLRGRDPELVRLLEDLGPAERRHWEMFYGLAAREVDAPALEGRWRFWLEQERELIAARGVAPTVHG